LHNEGKEVDAIDEYFKNPNPFSASFLIARQNNMDMALKIYQAAKNNSSLNFFVVMALISNFGKRNEHQEKLDTFLDDLMIEIDKMQERDIAKVGVANWGSILKSLCLRYKEKYAIKLIDIVQKYDIRLDIRIYTFILKTCTEKGWIKLGKRIHKLIEQNGRMDLILKNCLINMYGKCGCLDEAVKIFNDIKLSERNAIIWTTMISAYGEHGKGSEALILYAKKRSKTK
jgi:pentatricopeptide repeat protein